MVARRWVWGAVAAAGVLWALRAAHAQDETDEAPPGPPATRPTPGTGPTAPARIASQPQAATAASAAPAAKGPTAAASAPRRPAFSGYAAESARTATRLPREEREARAFLRAAAVAGRVDLEASRLAATRAQDPALRAFAEDVVQVRASADAEVLHLLHVRGMAMPMMDTAQRKALVRLSRATGPKFDREFLALVGAAGQRGEIALYEHAALELADPVIKGWIERQLPQLREQEEGSRRLQPREASRDTRHLRRADVRPAPVSRVGQGPARQRVE